jgi:prepilin peptidase CpaA
VKNALPRLCYGVAIAAGTAAAMAVFVWDTGSIYAGY